MADFEQEDAEMTGIDDAIEFVLMNVEPGGAVEAECELRISSSERAYLLPGPVHVAGDLKFNREKFHHATVIIAGGLTVDGVLEDCGGDDCTIVVMGDLVAGHLLCKTSWLVSGAVTVAGTVVGWGTQDEQFVCDGGATCDVLIESGYHIGAKARVAAAVEADKKGQLEPACLRDDGAFDFSEIVRRMKAGEPILKR